MAEWEQSAHFSTEHGTPVDNTRSHSGIRTLVLLMEAAEQRALAQQDLVVTSIPVHLHPAHWHAKHHSLLEQRRGKNFFAC